MDHWTCRRTVELKGGWGEGAQTSAEVDREMLDVHADLQADRQTSMQTDGRNGWVGGKFMSEAKLRPWRAKLMIVQNHYFRGSICLYTFIGKYNLEIKHLCCVQLLWIN